MKNIGIATLLATFAASISQASAQEVTLKIADSLPAEHIITKNTTEVFMAKVKEALGDKVAFQHFPAEQLGKAKDLLTVTQSGIADIGYIVPSYVSEKMPLGAVAELPGGTTSSCDGTLAFSALVKPGGMLDGLEIEPNGIRVLYSVVLSPYQAIFSPRAEVAGFADIAGKKIRSNPGPMELSLQSIGGTPVRMTPPEIFDAMTKGTIDGALLPFTSTFSYGLEQVIGSTTQGANFGSVGITYSISLNKWNQLAPDVQEALTKAGEEVTRSACVAFDEAELELAKQLEQAGVTLFEFTEEEKAEVEERFSGIADQWASHLDDRGLQGTEVLEAFRSEMAKSDD